MIRPENKVLSATLRMSDIKKVTLCYVEGRNAEYLIAKDEVDTFVEASKRLHFDPGRNPHNNEKTAQVWKITVADLEFRGPFWWTVPDLQNNGDPRGARIIDGGRERVAFIDNATVARWHAEEAEAEAEHYRAQERHYARSKPQSAAPASDTTGDRRDG